MGGAVGGAPARGARPDVINAAGRLENGAEVSVQIASVPSGGGGTRLDIYGREGAMTLAAG